MIQKGEHAFYIINTDLTSKTYPHSNLCYWLVETDLTNGKLKKAHFSLSDNHIDKEVKNMILEKMVQKEIRNANGEIIHKNQEVEISISNIKYIYLGIIKKIHTHLISRL